jgi:hypothetical protein
VIGSTEEEEEEDEERTFNILLLVLREVEIVSMLLFSKVANELIDTGIYGGEGGGVGALDLFFLFL